MKRYAIVATKNFCKNEISTTQVDKNVILRLAKREKKDIPKMTKMSS